MAFFIFVNMNYHRIKTLQTYFNFRQFVEYINSYFHGYLGIDVIKGLWH